MIRAWAMAAALALGGTSATHAADAPARATVEHERGEFRFTVAPAPAFVVARDVPLQWDAAVGASDDHWRNWLIDRQVDRRDAAMVNYFDHAYEPMTPQLVAEAAKFSIEFNPTYQTLALHRVELRRDGKWLDRLDPAAISLARRESGFEQDMSDGSVAALIVLADVRPHDVVRISYSITGSNPVLAGQFAHMFPLAWVDPILVRYGRVVYPAGTKLVVNRHDTAVEVVQHASDDGVEAAFAAHGIAAVRAPDDLPSWYRPYAYLEIGPERRWADVVAWALPLYPESIALPDELAARVAAWRALGDPRLEAMAVLNAVQDEVRYFGIEMGDSTHRPAAPGVTWERRFGDCKDKAYLTVALLRALGMKAEPALVSLDEGSGIRDLLPAASAFDHVIVRLRLDGKSYWLDPTLTQQRGKLDALDVIDYGVALPIVAGSDRLVDVVAPGKPDNAVEVVERFVPDADGKAVQLYVETRYVGQRAEFIRRRLRSERLEDIAAKYEDYYRKTYGPLGVVTPAAATEDDAANTVLLREHYRLEQGWDESGPGLRRLAAHADTLRTDTLLPASADRTAPIDLANPTRLSHEIRIELPTGWSLDEAPETLTIEAAPVRYVRTLAASGSTVSLKHSYAIGKTEVEPAQVERYLAKVRDIRNSLDRSVHLRVPADTGRSERDRRLQDLLHDVMSKEKQ
jgi:hypothetical protein